MSRPITSFITILGRRNGLVRDQARVSPTANWWSFSPTCIRGVSTNANADLIVSILGPPNAG